MVRKLVNLFGRYLSGAMLLNELVHQNYCQGLFFSEYFSILHKVNSGVPELLKLENKIR